MLEIRKPYSSIYDRQVHIEFLIWFVPDPLNQFHNPCLAMANNPAKTLPETVWLGYTDPNGMYTGIYDIDDDGGGGGNNDGDPGDGMEPGWDGIYHGPTGTQEPYRLSNYFNRGSQMLSHYSYLNNYGAHNGSFAPIFANGEVQYYDVMKGEYGYEKEYVDVFGTAIQWAYFPNNPEAKVIYKPLFGVVNEWVSFGNGTTTISGIPPDFSLGVSVGKPSALPVQFVLKFAFSLFKTKSYEQRASISTTG